MSAALDIVGAVLLGLGSVALLVGALGLLRFPDLFSRMHAAGVTDSLGGGSILIGLLFIGASPATLIKIGMVLFFLFVTSPTSGHALARAALYAGLRPKLTDGDDVEGPAPDLEAPPAPTTARREVL